MKIYVPAPPARWVDAAIKATHGAPPGWRKQLLRYLVMKPVLHWYTFAYLVWFRQQPDGVSGS